jgi:hypothetical protein
MMDTITLNDKIVSRSQNLRGILDYARKFPMESASVRRMPEGKAQVRFTFSNGAESLTLWESFRIASDWIRQRKSWGIEPKFDMLTMFDPDLYNTDSGDLSPTDYRWIVDHPGKFESEASYIPYMWDNLLNWGESPDWDLMETMGDNPLDIYRYDVDLVDYLLFPELLGTWFNPGIITTVYLYEDDQGFVNVYDLKSTVPESE